MNADHRTSLHKVLMPALLGAFLAGAAIAGVAVSFLSTPGAELEGEVGTPVSVAAPAEPKAEAPVEEGCGPGRVVEPGEYESIDRRGS